MAGSQLLKGQKKMILLSMVEGGLGCALLLLMRVGT